MGLLLLVPLALAGGGAHALDPAETNPNPLDEAVAVGFGWPVGLTCSSVSRVERAGFGPTGDRVYVVSDSFRVDAHPEGIAVRQGVAQVEVLSPRMVGPGADPLALVAQFAARAPDRVIAPDGSIRRLDRIEEFRAALRAEWDRAVLELPEAARERVSPLVAPFLDGRALQATWSQRWAATFGFWAGQRLPVGATAMAVTTEASPLLPEATLDWRHTFSIAERLSCADRECVRLVVDGQPTRDALLAALGAHGRSLLGAGVPEGEPVAWSAAKLTVHTELVVEPTTSVPHSLHREAHLYAEARWGVDRVAFVELSDRRQSTLACLVPP